MSIHTIFSRHLLEQRITQHLTQSQAAEKCGLSLRGYQKIESGRTLPTFENALHISYALHIDLDDVKMEVYGHAVSVSPL